MAAGLPFMTIGLGSTIRKLKAHLHLHQVNQQRVIRFILLLQKAAKPVPLIRNLIIVLIHQLVEHAQRKEALVEERFQVVVDAGNTEDKIKARQSETMRWQKGLED